MRAWGSCAGGKSRVRLVARSGGSHRPTLGQFSGSVKFIDFHRGILARCCHDERRRRSAARREARGTSGLWLCSLRASGCSPAAVIVASGPPAAAAAAPAGPDAAGVTWLCRPGLPGDPCLFPDGADSVAANGAKTVVPAAAGVPVRLRLLLRLSDRHRIGSHVQHGDRGDAGRRGARPWRRPPASPRSAASGRRRTASGPSASLAKGLGNDPTADRISYDSLLAGWKDYLAHDNDGRPVIFIGHSQGAANLIRLLRSQVDDDPALRARMVSAIILGGNVQVPVGKTVGGTFAHIPACTDDGPDRLRHRLLVVLVPAARRLALRSARPGRQPPIGPDGPRSGQQVLCTNPAALGSDRRGAADALLRLVGQCDRGAVGDLPGPLHGRLREQGRAPPGSRSTARPGDSRPVVTPTLGPTWGLHLDDVNLALGNLVDDVKAEETTYSAHHRRPPERPSRQPACRQRLLLADLAGSRCRRRNRP